MENFKNNNKILFIPGWLDTGGNYGYQNSLDIWNKNIDISQDFNVEYVIAHSVGSLVALYNWKIYKNFKIILVNPVISKKGLFKRWCKFITSEGVSDSFKKSINIYRIIPSLIKMIRLLKLPAFTIIDSIPNEDLVIIYGENDKYLIDEEFKERFRGRGIKIKKISGAGHNYDENIEKAVLEVIS